MTAFHQNKDKSTIHNNLLLDSISINDIVQGKFDNSWLLSTIASLMSMPKLIKRVFVTDKQNNYGFINV